MFGDTASKWKRAALWSLPLVLILAAFVPVHGSSFATAAYAIIENAGTPLTQRSVLNFTGAGVSCVDDGTNKRTTCTISGSSGSFGGVNEQSGPLYVAGSGDAGRLIVMNCSSACVASLPASPPSSTWAIGIVSIGSTLATVSVNSLDFNGGATAPVLTTSQLLLVYTDGTNWFGNGLWSASTNVTFTCGVTGCAISASGGGAGPTGATGATGATGPSGPSGPTGPAGAGGIVTYAALSVVLSGGTGAVYVPLGGDGLGSSTEANVNMKVQPVLTFQNACVTLSSAPGSGNSIAVTLRDNATAEPVTMTVSGASATSQCDSTHTFSNSAGDLMDWSIVPSGVIAAYTPNVMISVQTGAASGTGSASRGTFASRGSCSSAGSSYYSTDVAILSECNGSTWADWVTGQPVTLPSLTTFTGQNMAGGGGATLTTNGVIDMVTTGQSGDQIHGQYITLPSTPFNIDACFTLNTLTIGANLLGLYVSDGTKLVTFQSQTNSGSNNFVNLQIGYWNSVTSFNTGPVSVQTMFAGAGQYCLRWNDNGTNVLFSVRIPPSTTWWQFASLGRAAFLTPTQVGWFMDSNTTVVATDIGNIFHWLQH